MKMTIIELRFVRAEESNIGIWETRREVVLVPTCDPVIERLLAKGYKLEAAKIQDGY